MNIRDSLTFTSFVLHGLLLSHGQAKPHTKIAVTRTFSLSDISKLPATFDAWNTFPPCTGAPTYSADLFLVYPKSLKNSNGIMDFINGIRSIHTETNGWGGCIDNVIGIGCDIESSSDIYDPQEVKTNPLRVNGPNRQFERTVHDLQRSLDGPYDLIYLMEMDIVPIKSNWLDLFVDEIESNTMNLAMTRR